MRLLIPPPVALLIAAALAWALARETPLTAFDFPGRAVAAVVILLAGLALMLTAAWSFWRAGTSINPLRPGRARVLLTDGVFALSRNPIYLADVLLLLALVVWLGVPLNLLVVAGFAGYLQRYQIRPEERALAAKFGAEYARYRRSVRRWLGRYTIARHH